VCKSERRARVNARAGCVIIVGVWNVERGMNRRKKV
jgi:hypothetical protein